MTTYRIGLTQTIYEECTVYVEADTREQAEQLAVKKAKLEDVHWSFMEAVGDIEIATLDVAPAGTAL